NQPISIRTREALASVGLEAPGHRAHQLTEADVQNADLIVAMAAEHVHYVRRRHPVATDRTATICWLVSNLKPGSDPLRSRVAASGLSAVGPDSQGDVADPAGGELDDYIDCARELRVLVTDLVQRL
ncbi:MAG TPA: hypothetical protein VEJ87_13910, partial [Acidimicrobiales bacterium]|nr:hypothetical protein [Acidimicrobiales bacterium]